MSSKNELFEMGLPRCKSLSPKTRLPPLLSREGLTDYPKKGMDLPIMFENSEFALFPFDVALLLAVNFPKAWCSGGNHFGNHAFEYWFAATDALSRGDKIPESSLRWMKKREQYIARHRGDFRLAGIVAMIKWAGFVDGPGGNGQGSITGSSFEFMLDSISDYGK